MSLSVHAQFLLVALWQVYDGTHLYHYQQLMEISRVVRKRVDYAVAADQLELLGLVEWRFAPLIPRLLDLTEAGKVFAKSEEPAGGWAQVSL